jgi:alginate O-acetyltransferase complex protein AlgI
MIFTSYMYLLFLTAAFLLHWSLPKPLRNPLLIVLSYAFYCSWKWQFGFLLLAVSIFTWTFGGLLARRDGNRGWLALGIAVELLPLAYYKYAGFLTSNATALVSAFGSRWHPPVPDVVLPLGISFFTFQGIAYLVDVANGEAPIRRSDHFLLYKAFWPQLIAGPIIRPHEIREQIAADRQIEYPDVSEGAKRILNGFFKKAVLADTLAPYVDAVFQTTAQPAGLDCAVGTVAFAMQIYFDFSGYSDIAIGSARLLGFRFPENFDYPYRACSPQEFWARWHMTLTRWIRDYVFTPLAFASRRRPTLGLVWLVLAMALCGLWHGGRWTFVLWGIWHGVLLVANQTVLRKLWPKSDGPRSGFASVLRLFAWATTMLGVGAGWVLFRAQSVMQARSMFGAILTMRGGVRPAVLRENGVLIVASFWVGLLLLQILSRPVRQVAERLAAYAAGYRAMKAVFYTGLVLSIVVFERDVQAFVYFQF